MIDVAREAGVSTATVSRVVNKAAEVSDDTRQAVIKAIADLDYRPNPLARDLRQARSKRILVLLPELNSPVMSDVFAGIVGVARKEGYIPLLSPTSRDRTRETELLELLRNRSVDGIIFFGTTMTSDELIELGIEYCAVQCLEWKRAPTTSIVSIDDCLAGYELTEHLLALGHRRIALLGNRAEHTGALREDGYRRALAEAGLGFDQSLVVDGDYGFDHGREGARKLLTSATPPTAIFCVSDMIAAGVITEARVLGVHTPSEVAVVGFDDSREATMSVPPITTIRQPFAKIGRIAMRTLLNNLSHASDRRVKHQIVPHELIVRESTVPSV